VIVPKRGASLSEREVTEHCRKSLAAYKVPRLIRFAAEAELPLTSTGKVQKNRLASTFFISDR
jgi:fatty-acyl-CoA synthase